MKNNHITIIGGSGFVGSHLAARLAQQNYSIKILTRNQDLSRHLSVLPQVELVQGNVHSNRFLRRALAGSDCVINLVGVLNQSRGTGQSFNEAHVGLTKKVLAACNDLGIKKYIHMSSLKADAENGPSEYLKTKGQAEQEVRRNQNAALKWSILQPSVMFGSDDSFVNRFAKLLSIPLPIFLQPRANARLAPVYVEDTVLAIEKCIEDKETNGMTFQLCGPHVFSMKEIMQLIADTIGSKTKIKAMPDGLAKMVAVVAEWLPGKPFSTDNYRSLTVHSICDIDGFGRLGIKPRSLKSIILTYLGEHEKTKRFHRMRASAGR